VWRNKKDSTSHFVLSPLDLFLLWCSRSIPWPNFSPPCLTACSSQPSLVSFFWENTFPRTDRRKYLVHSDWSVQHRLPPPTFPPCLSSAENCLSVFPDRLTFAPLSQAGLLERPHALLKVPPLCMSLWLVSSFSVCLTHFGSPPFLGLLWRFLHSPSPTAPI